jgi:predicted glycosyltransferase involved in capsule biosynthesis
MKIKIALIIPFRESDNELKPRTYQLNQFIKYMESYLSGYNYKIFIIEQSGDDRKFNRGKLLNIGFLYAKKWGAQNFIFHDVDLLPSEELKQYYLTKPSKPIHIAAVWVRYNNNPKYFGGIVAFNFNDFVKINGYPNNYWGWGGEDDALFKRTIRFFKIFKPKNGTIVDLEDMNLIQKKEYLKDNKLIFMLKYEALAEENKTWKSNGLSDLQFIELVKTNIDTHCMHIIVEINIQF